jgi:hypothetical protein
MYSSHQSETALNLRDELSESAISSGDDGRPNSYLNFIIRFVGTIFGVSRFSSLNGISSVTDPSMHWHVSTSHHTASQQNPSFGHFRSTSITEQQGTGVYRSLNGSIPIQYDGPPTECLKGQESCILHQKSV